MPEHVGTLGLTEIVVSLTTHASNSLFELGDIDAVDFELPATAELLLVKLEIVMAMNIVYRDKPLEGKLNQIDLMKSSNLFLSQFQGATVSASFQP